MNRQFKYRGQAVTSKNIAFINQLIAENPNDSRRVLSKKLCLAWNWVQPNGALRDMVCRGLMLELDRAGYIKLPAKKFSPHNPFIHRKKPAAIKIDQTPIDTALANIQPLEFRQVRRTCSEKLFNSLFWLVFSTTSYRLSRPIYRLVGKQPQKAHSSYRLQYPIFDTALGSGITSGISYIGPDCQSSSSRLATHIPPPCLLP
jgi:hypothetical protein